MIYNFPSVVLYIRININEIMIDLRRIHKQKREKKARKEEEDEKKKKMNLFLSVRSIFIGIAKKGRENLMRFFVASSCDIKTISNILIIIPKSNFSFPCLFLLFSLSPLHDIRDATKQTYNSMRKTRRKRKREMNSKVKMFRFKACQ